MSTISMEKPRVALLIPSYKMVPSTTVISLVKLIAENIDIISAVCIESGIYISQARNALMMQAVAKYKEEEITHVFWVDDDMMLPPGALPALLGTGKKVVSGVYYGRDLKPVVYKLDPFRKATKVPSSGVHEVDGAGFGCLLMDAHTLYCMNEIYGAFIFQTPVETDEEGNTGFVGEDVYFFKLLKEMGIPAHLDCDIQCGHIGNFVTNSVVVEMANQMGLAALEVEG